MPTYQYSCTECGHFFEQVQSFSDDALSTCPECEGRLRKVFNAVGVVFKGSGFYRTDSRPKASESGSSGGDAGSGGSSTDGSSPAKTSSASPSATPAASSSKASSGTSAA